MNIMDYDAAFATFIEQMKLDKDVAQPWRNYAVKAMNEAQAFIRMGPMPFKYEERFIF